MGIGAASTHCITLWGRTFCPCKSCVRNFYAFIWDYIHFYSVCSYPVGQVNVSTMCRCNFSIIMCYHHPSRSSIHHCSVLNNQQDEKDRPLTQYVRRRGKYTLTSRLTQNRFEQTSSVFVYILYTTHTMPPLWHCLTCCNGMKGKERDHSDEYTTL